MQDDEFYSAPQSEIIDSSNDPKRPNATIISLLVLVLLGQLVTSMIVALDENLLGFSFLAYLLFVLVLIPGIFTLVFQLNQRFRNSRARATLVLVSATLFLLIQLAYLFK